MFYLTEIHVKRTHVSTYFRMLWNIKDTLSSADNDPASIPGQTPLPAEGIWGVHIFSLQGCNSLKLWRRVIADRMSSAKQHKEGFHQWTTNFVVHTAQPQLHWCWHYPENTYFNLTHKNIQNTKEKRKEKKNNLWMSCLFSCQIRKFATQHNTTHHTKS